MNNTRRAAFSCLSPLLLFGCGPTDGGTAQADEDIGSAEEAVYVAQGASLFTANDYVVPVCFTNDGYAGDKTFIKDAVRAQWGANSRLTFTGFGKCSASPSPETVVIQLVWYNTVAGGGDTGVGMGARRADGTNMHLAVDQARTLHGIFAVHEMGHALGLWHEHQRPDRVSVGCLGDPNANNQVWILNGGTSASLYDPNSVMNYCRDIDGNGITDMDMNHETVDHSQLSRLDIAGLENVYGVPTGMNLDAGFVWVSTTAAGASTPLPRFSWNSAGATNTVTRNGAGNYLVSMPVIGGTIGGDVQVTATGSSKRCVSGGWNSNGTTLQASVFCTTPAGAASDSPFTLSYLRRGGAPGAEGAYVWASQPTTATYTPTDAYVWNSSGKSVTVNRNNTGTYQVVLDGQGLTGGTVEVTAYGGTQGQYCKVTGWSSDGVKQFIGVLCLNAAGAVTDSMFDLNYSKTSPGGSQSYGYAWADQPGSASYTPSATYQFAAVSRGDWTRIVQPAAQITRSATGQYQVKFPGLFFTSDDLALYGKTNVNVTAYGGDANYCTVSGWAGDTASATAFVNCYAPGGAAADSRFDVTLSSTLAR